MSWKVTFEQGKEIVLSTFSENSGPHSIVVISQGFVGEKLVVGACQTKTTLQNIKNNKRVAIIGMSGGKYLRLKGIARIQTSGKYFNAVKKRNKGPKAKCAIIVEINEIFDLDKVKKNL